MFKTKAFGIGLAVGIFFAGILAAVVGVVNPVTKAVNFGGALIVIFGFAALIYGVTRKA
jgi:hypothetical protein